jgi:hypothetical protein
VVFSRDVVVSRLSRDRVGIDTRRSPKLRQASSACHWLMPKFCLDSPMLCNWPVPKFLCMAACSLRQACGGKSHEQDIWHLRHQISVSTMNPIGLRRNSIYVPDSLESRSAKRLSRKGVPEPSEWLDSLSGWIRYLLPCKTQAHVRPRVRTIEQPAMRLPARYGIGSFITYTEQWWGEKAGTASLPLAFAQNLYMPYRSH